jgi:hypothetical protein
MSPWRDAAGHLNALREEQVDETLPAYAKGFVRHLQAAFDERLDLVKAKPYADAPGLVACHWHVRRRNDGAPDSYMPISSPTGEYQEPNDGVIRDLSSRNLWNDANWRRFREQDSVLAAQREVEREKARQERVAQMAEHVESSQRLSVRF